MKRLARNRVNIVEDHIEPRNSFEMQYGEPSGRNMNGDDESSNFENSEWMRTARTVRRTQSLHRNALQNDLIKMLPSRHNALYGKYMQFF